MRGTTCVWHHGSLRLWESCAESAIRWRYMETLDLRGTWLHQRCGHTSYLQQLWHHGSWPANDIWSYVCVSMVTIRIFMNSHVKEVQNTCEDRPQWYRWCCYGNQPQVCPPLGGGENQIQIAAHQESLDTCDNNNNYITPNSTSMVELLAVKFVHKPSTSSLEVDLLENFSRWVFFLLGKKREAVKWSRTKVEHTSSFCCTAKSMLEEKWGLPTERHK